MVCKISGEFRSAVPAVSLPSLLTGCGKKAPCCCAGIAQQQTKHWCVINTVLFTNPRHSTIQAAIKKITLMPARSGTAEHKNFKHIPTRYFAVTPKFIVIL